MPLSLIGFLTLMSRIVTNEWDAKRLVLDKGINPPLQMPWGCGAMVNWLLPVMEAVSQLAFYICLTVYTTF